MSYPLWYIRHMIMNEERQAKILLNNEVKVTDHRSQFCGRTGIVTDIMADGRTLEIEIQERTQFAKTPQSLGPVANHLVKDAI